MKTFFLHAEIQEDREILSSVLERHFDSGLFKQFSITYNQDRDFSRIDISDNVSIEMMKNFISEVPEGHRMLQTLATNIEESEYNWQDLYLASS
ncbi:Uncharacterised protein [Salmonella enterica subsp. enterica]|uniref:Uncharacterized protein n=1 Tax=Salmonella enterica I TaxID=59201 RepID=A0A379Y2M1_SALET|nr:Uncharacterised protein [Salmonella enterica subsp. enterica]